MARKTTLRGTRTKLTTSVADLGSVVRLDSNHFNTFSFSFVLDEALQLEETPITENPVHSFSFSLFPDAFQVFHYNLVSIEIGNNVFTDTMVFMLHEPLLSTRNCFKQSLSRPCAFTLKLGTQISELSFDLLDFGRIIKPAVRTDGKVVYSEVNAQNGLLRATVLLSGINLFRECEDKEASASLVNPKKTFSYFPSEVFFIAVRDGERELLPSFDCSKTQNIFFIAGTSWEVVSHRSFVDYWFGFSLLDHSAGLLDASNSELALQTIGFESRINKRMEFDIIPYLVLPCNINAELQSFCIDFQSVNYLLGGIDSYFSTNSCSHSLNVESHIFKTFGNEETGFLPCLKTGVSALTIL